MEKIMSKTNTATKKKSLLSSAKQQVKAAKTTPKVRFGKFDPDAKSKATGKKVTAEANNKRVEAVDGKTVRDAIATGLYSMADLRYDIEKVKTLEIV